MDQWVEEEGMLAQTFECEDFRDAIDLINQIAIVAEEADHHPDLLLFDYKFVSVMLKTHEKDAITDKDYDMAARIDEVAESV